jgi:hypothetical protein
VEGVATEVAPAIEAGPTLLSARKAGGQECPLHHGDGIFCLLFIHREIE